MHVTGKVNAQSRQVPNKPEFDLAPYHFGFLLGVNKMFFTVKTFPGYQEKIYYNNNSKQSLPDQNVDSAYLFNMEATPTIGFVIGIVSNLRLGKYFDLRFIPSLTFGERNLDYTIKSYYDTPEPNMLYVTKNIQSTFVEFPLMVRFKGKRIHNAKPYVLAGGKWALDLASNAKKKHENQNAFVFINRKDFYAIGGVGFDFYTAFFKLGTELSMSYGIFDIIKHDNTIYTDAVEHMSSKIFQFSLTFEGN
jgi:hypothetical protein